MLKFIKRALRRKVRIVSVSHTELAIYAVMSDGRVFCRGRHNNGSWFEPEVFVELRGE